MPAPFQSSICPTTMCRGGKRSCTELGASPAQWSRTAPLLPPGWMLAQIDPLIMALESAAIGDISTACLTLESVDNDRLRYWYVEHGQVSGTCRSYILGRTSRTRSAASIGSRQPSADLAREVLRRDQYVCRYCGIRTIPREVFALFSTLLGAEAFRATGDNSQRHGAVLAFRANVDHVTPWHLGGATVADNLVTSCWCCNYGKANFTLEQLGLEDPRDRQPETAPVWDGLTHLIPALKREIGVRVDFLTPTDRV